MPGTAFHDNTGPVAPIHLLLNTHNCFIQEMVRAFYSGWYSDLVTQLPLTTNGDRKGPDTASACTGYPQTNGSSRPRTKL